MRCSSLWLRANTVSLQVMLLQADYNRAESLVGQWISDSANVAARDEAKDILAGEKRVYSTANTGFLM